MTVKTRDAEAPLRMSGRYAYFCNGKRTDIIESFTILIENGHWIVTSSRTSKNFAFSACVKAQVSLEDFLLPKVEVRWTAHKEKYCIDTEMNSKSLIFTLNGITDSLPLKGPTIYFPLLRIFMGPILRFLEKHQNTTTLIIPNIKVPAGHKDFLKPEKTKRKATLIERTTYMPKAQTPIISDLHSYAENRAIPCRKFEYEGDQYEKGTYVTIDDNDILLHYAWQQDAKTQWDIHIEDYTLSLAAEAEAD
ncbi:hypothetical protein QGN29_04080 [Temperatibacter marinus]|uniref:Uncharacterized protein n=1 Tax=Temperatibacter marinus TaxID=1456591 RepID=A0AA52EIR1_9PROT|nr:hypothetical protein [Temperatibacter marinus]WND03550.1 hypothetical protein QGN29_04080 [Temperatibacter marinus]